LTLRAVRCPCKLRRRVVDPRRRSSFRAGIRSYGRSATRTASANGS